MAEIAAKKLYVGDELVYEKPEMKIIYMNVDLTGGSANTEKIIDMSPQSPDFSSENITITVINQNNRFTKTFKTSEWLTGDQKLIGDLTTGQVIENPDYFNYSKFFKVYYLQNSTYPYPNLRVTSQKPITIIIYTL